ncbi:MULTISPECIES: helix-turn-helix domain-containing protein [Echinicola]|uniref:helix-turn-helix domain-containing protein n=1 Tax=Echinicola TaxID=390846 RepID=UPI0035709A0E
MLLYLLEKGKISRKEAGNLMGLKNTKIYEILAKMVVQNLIKKQDKGRATPTNYKAFSPSFPNVTTL